ncbi:O-antigen ligase family protein [Aquitalea sp. S1-19]|nr:O-antigen ligase family protein [Aquitalea sp. S1-19]
MQKNIANDLIAVLCGLSIALAFINPALSRDLFYTSTGLATLYFIVKKINPAKTMGLIGFSFIAFGLYKVGRTLLETGTLNPSADALQVYLATGYRFILGAFLISFLRRKECKLDSLMPIFLITSLLTSFYIASTDVLIKGLSRGGNDIGYRATNFSYMVTAIYLTYLGLSINNTSRNIVNTITIFTVSLMAWATIILTGTRAAMIAIAIGSMFLLIKSNIKFKKETTLVTLLLITISSAALYSNHIKPRIMEAQLDISSYIDNSNKATSIGARFEMWKAGIKSFEQSPILGLGYHGREIFIKNQVSLGTLDPITDHFSTVHMHNELIEELSTRGLIGGSLLILIYIASITTRTSEKNKLALYGTAYSYMLFGLSDVLFFSRESSSLFILLIALVVINSEEKNILK